MWLVARKVTSGVPGRLQAAVEFLVEMVDRESKGIVHNAQSRKLVAPMALSVFVWVFLLNAMDLLPVDLLPLIWQWIYGAAGHDPEHAYLRVVPTADISVTLGLSVAVLIACLIYSIKIKGLGGWAHELITAPFGVAEADRQSAHLDRLRADVRRQLRDADDRVRLQDRVARHASVRQHVRG